MVTTTTNDDEMPTHDANGTDLRRVMAMHARGYSEGMIAEALGIPPYQVRYALVVATGDTEGGPGPDELEALCREIQAGWTPDMAVAARRGELRQSSRVVRPDADAAKARSMAKLREHWHRKALLRAQTGPIPIVFHAEFASERKYLARVSFCGTHAQRFCASHEEAETWGRAWLRKQIEVQQAEVCCGT